MSKMHIYDHGRKREHTRDAESHSLRARGSINELCCRPAAPMGALNELERIVSLQTV